MIERFIQVLAVAAIACAPLIARAESPYAPLRPLPLGSTLLTLPSTHVAGERTWEVQFAHRFIGSADEGSLSDRIHSMWGLDGGAAVSFGLSYVPVRDLELSLTRSNVMDDVEVAAKYVIVQQAGAIPISLTLRGGGDWRTERNLEDRTSLFAQAIVSRQVGGRGEIFVLPTFVTNAGRATSGARSLALFDHATNVPVGFAFLIRPNTSVVAEWVPLNRDLPSSVDSEFGWALGLKRVIGGHHFEFMVTNSTATTVDQYVTTTSLGTALRRGDIHIGFNIERQFGGKR